MPEGQQFQAVLVLPEGLTREQIEELKSAFMTHLVATLGGEVFLRDNGISVVCSDIIERAVVFPPSEPRGA